MRFWFFIPAIVIWAAPAHAATATVTQALNFGKWFITSNAGDYTVTINTDGSHSHAPELVMISPPQKGIYDIGGLAISTAITSIVVTQTQALTTGGGEILNMDSFQVDALPATDGAGHLALTLGATAHTSGGGGGYGNNIYTGQLDIQINY